ncbi:MFS transporter [Streptomyces sp. NPDC006704]|uniref:MFS transporter n=1 Tax=Streptomyces sp. NPDC006704 TaxID=3364760 RepID=UPI0036B92E75
MSGPGGHRDRRPLTAVLTANAVSAAGSSLTLIGVPWFVLQTTGSAGRAGVVAFCATLPIVVSALAGGPVIDRVGRRRVSVGSDVVCGLAVATIPLLHQAGLLAFWLLCALMALGGLAHTPGTTARAVLLPDLARRSGLSLARAASAYDAVARGARMTGAALAGVLIALTGAGNVLLIDGATFAVSALLVAAGLRGLPEARPLRGAPPVTVRTYKAELREGYAHLARTRLLLAVVAMVMLMNGTDQGWNAVLLPVHAERYLGGASQLGLLTALFGAGGLAGALLYGLVGHRFSRRTVFSVCVLLCGAPRYAVAALTHTTLPLAVTMVVAGLAGGTLNPILTTVIYERVPDALRSRVSGVLTAGCELAMPLGGIAAGLLVESAGPRGALLVVGGVYLLATLSPLVFPAWRGLAAGPGGAGEAGAEAAGTGGEEVGAALSRTGPRHPCAAPAARTPRPSVS